MARKTIAELEIKLEATNHEWEDLQDKFAALQRENTDLKRQLNIVTLDLSETEIALKVAEEKIEQFEDMPQVRTTKIYTKNSVDGMTWHVTYRQLSNGFGKAENGAWHSISEYPEFLKCCADKKCVVIHK